MEKRIYLIALLLAQILAFSQKLDHGASFRDINSSSYFRFHYDNDYFASRDRDYTQGYNFELVANGLRKNPINMLFLKPKNSVSKYGLAIEHIGFAPNNIKSSEIQYGDRPFAAAIYLKSFVITTDTIHKSRLSAAFSLGIMGPGAFGKEMQEAIHKSTGNTLPQGWQNQIRNDAVVQYEVNYEKQLLRFGNLAALQVSTSAKVGTLFTNANLGLNAVIGILNTPFAGTQNRKKFALYFYSQPMATFVGYDATLQGGLFNRESPYTIASGSVKRVTAQHNYGFVVQTKTLYFEYFRTAITKEFDSGIAAKWGGIKIGFTF